MSFKGKWRKEIESGDSKAELLKAGVELFAKHGVDGTTVRDIAKLAGTNLCMVSYHFGGKEGLYRACLENYGKARQEMTKDVMHPSKNFAEFQLQLRQLLTVIVNSQASNPELTKMLLREIESGLPHAADVFENTFFKVTKEMIDFFYRAQKDGIIDEKLDPSMLAFILYGMISHALRFEQINKKYYNRQTRAPEYTEELIENIMIIFTKGLKKQGESV